MASNGFTVTTLALALAEPAAACIPGLALGNGAGSNLAVNLPPFQGQPFDGHAGPLALTEAVGGNWLAPLAVLARKAEQVSGESRRAGISLRGQW